MRGPLSKHPLGNITTLDVSLGSLLLQSDHQVIQAKARNRAAECLRAWFLPLAAAPLRRGDFALGANSLIH